MTRAYVELIARIVESCNKAYKFLQSGIAGFRDHYERLSGSLEGVMWQEELRGERKSQGRGGRRGSDPFLWVLSGYNAARSRLPHPTRWQNGISDWKWSCFARRHCLLKSARTFLGHFLLFHSVGSRIVRVPGAFLYLSSSRHCWSGGYCVPSALSRSNLWLLIYG